MADGGEIAALFATLGLKVNAGQWAQGNAQIGQTQAALGRLGAAGTPGLRQAQVALGQLSTGAGTLSKMLGGVAPAANQAGAAAASAGHQAAAGFDAAGAAIKGYLLYLGGHFGYEHLIAFNQEMQDNTISLAAMIEGQLGGSFQQATAHAKELYGEWQKFSTQTPVTTAEIVEFGKNIAAATFNAKGSIKDLTQLTEQGVIAAKVLAGNRNPGYAALEISEMLSGNVSNRMMFVKQLLGMIHMTEEQFRGLDEKGRLEAVKKALGSDAFKDAAQAFGASFSGVTSTLKDKLQIAAGKIGLPIFERLVEAVSRFNAWLDEHSDTIEEYGKRIGDFLGRAFDILSAAVGVVIDKGGELLDWLGQFVDGGELAKSLIIALGAVLTAFAIQSAIAFATNPITLVIMAVTALVYAIRWLMQHPEKVRKAFNDAFDWIANAASTVADAIKSAFNALLDDTGISTLIDAYNFFTGKKSAADKKTMAEDHMSPDDLWRKYHPDATGGSDPELQPDVAPSAPAAPPVRMLPATGSSSSGPVSVNVNVGDINVHSPNADPVAVADSVRKTFHEELGKTLRNVQDVYG